MLPDAITLNVDETNTSTQVSTTWTRTDFLNTRSVYHAGSHSLLLRDTLDFYRTFPSKSGNFNGTAKCSFKITDDAIVDGVDSTTSLVAPIIGQVSFSIPVGASDVDCLKLRQRIIALLDSDATMNKLFSLEV